MKTCWLTWIVMMAIPMGCKEVCLSACWFFSFMGKYLTDLREDFECESVCRRLLDTIWTKLFVRHLLNFEISSEFRQYFQKMEFRKNSDILPKILIHKEVVLFVWNYAFSDKNNKFRQNGQVSLPLAEFSATIFSAEFRKKLLVSNCLNSAKKSKAISETSVSSLWIRLQIISKNQKLFCEINFLK